MREPAAHTCLQPKVANGNFHTVSTQFYRSRILLSWESESMAGSSERWIFPEKILQIEGDLKDECSMKNGTSGPRVGKAA